jgi:hypothetical protein
LPRYHFDVQTPRGLAQDHEVEDYLSEPDALKDALYSARKLSSERVLLGDPLAGWAIIVRDKANQALRTFHLSEIV